MNDSLSLDEILSMEDPIGFLLDYSETNGGLPKGYENIYLELIKNEGYFIYRYATYKNKRLPLKWEQILLKVGDCWDLYHYAKNVIKGRWIEAEPIIKQDPHYWSWYQNTIKEKHGEMDSFELSAR